MGDYDTGHKTELFDHAGQDEFMLYSRSQVIGVLKEIAKRPDIITAYFGGGKHHMLTAVLGVIPERGLLVLDYGPDESLNRKLIDSDRVVCVTKHEGISVRFSLSGLGKAKFQGQEVFAAPLPESVLRLQRREFFRVHTPVVNPVTCRIARPQGKDLTLPVLDMSVGGVGMLDHSLSLEAVPTVVLPQCTLVIPEFDSFTIDLEVRSAIRHRQRDGSEATRIGCQFVNLRGSNLVTVQRYINKLQVEQRASHPDG